MVWEEFSPNGRCGISANDKRGLAGQEENVPGPLNVYIFAC